MKRHIRKVYDDLPTDYRSATAPHTPNRLLSGHDVAFCHHMGYYDFSHIYTNSLYSALKSTSAKKITTYILPVCLLIPDSAKDGIV